MIRAFRLLNLRRVRRQPVRAAVVLLSVAAGVALAASVLVLRTSLDRSLEEYGRSLAGPAPLRVVGAATPGGLAADVTERVAAVDGVREAVPLVQAVTFAVDSGGDQRFVVALGFDCRIEALVGDFACSPDAVAAAEDDTLVVSPRLARELGRGGYVRTNLAHVPTRTALVVETLDEVNDGLTVAFPMPVAQHLLSRPDALDVAYVLPEDGVDPRTLRDAVAEAAGAHNLVLDADDPPPAFANFGMLVPLLGLVSLFALATGAILVHNTITLSIEERRRDLAVVGALGGPRRVLFGGPLAEAGILGIVGGLLGSAAGTVLARPLVASMSGFTEIVLGTPLRTHISPMTFVVGAFLGALVAVLAVIAPARRAARLDVVSELRGGTGASDAGTTPGWRKPAAFSAAAVVAMGLSAVARRGGGLEVWQVLLGQAAVIAFAVLGFIAVGTAGPWLFHRARHRLRAGSIPHLAATSLARDPRRTYVMVLATAAAIGLGFMIGSFGRMMNTGLAEGRLEETGHGIWVSTLPRNNSLNVEGRLTPEVMGRLAEMPGVDSVRSGFTFGVVAGPDVMWGVQAIDDPLFRFEVLQGTADTDAFRRGEVLIGPGLARTEGVRAGGLLRVPGRHGFVDLRVQGIWANGDFNGFQIHMPEDLALHTWGPQARAAAIVHPQAGTTADELAQRIEAARLHPHLSVETPAQQVASAADDIAGFLQPFWALQRALLAIAFAAVLFTLLLAAIRRQRELGLLAAVGASPRHLAGVVVLEAVAVAVAGGVLGGVAGLGMLETFRNAFFLTVPYVNPYVLDPLALPVYTALALGVLTLAAAWPSWRAARIEVIEALRYE